MIQGSDGSSGPEDLALQRGRACAEEAVKSECAYPHKKASGGKKKDKEKKREKRIERTREITRAGEPLTVFPGNLLQCRLGITKRLLELPLCPAKAVAIVGRADIFKVPFVDEKLDEPLELEWGLRCWVETGTAHRHRSGPAMS